RALEERPDRDAGLRRIHDEAGELPRVIDVRSELAIDVLGRRHQLVLELAGKHVALDACAALAAVLAAGAPIDHALLGLSRARLSWMRGEVVELAHRKVIVDCYNANPASMSAALRLLAERGQGHTALAVLGDMLEL